MSKKSLLIACGSIFGLVIVAILFLLILPQNTPAANKDLSENFPAEASELRALKEKWKNTIQEVGADEAYAAFLEQAPKEKLSTHSQAHAFGEALYQAEGLEGLRTCDSSFEFGCYHSFFGVAVNIEGIEALPKFDQACKSKFGGENLPCQHGIGHGVLVYTDYENLNDALELCETISDLPTGGCSSGVFMEYNFHTMDESRGEGYSRELGENPYEPCDALQERFQASCYFEQVQWWQSVFSGDFKRIGELCAPLTKDSGIYNACYNGAGNYVAAAAKFDFDQMVALCGLMPSPDAVGLCHEGATWLVRSEEDGKPVATRLCEILEEPYKSQCLQKLQ